MKVLLSAAAVGAALMMSAGAANASLLYQLDVTTTYLDGSVDRSGLGTQLGGLAPSPDTGFAVFTNSGPSTFTGTIGDIAVAGNGLGVDFSQTYAGVTLNPGDSVYFSINDESSNYGGFNGPSGVVLLINGLFGATAVNISVNDADIHSGVVRTDPFGVDTDSYVLQGGDPLGRDTGDAFEETQANGHARFSAQDGGVPEPASWALMLTGFFGMGAAMRSVRKSKGATA